MFGSEKLDFRDDIETKGDYKGLQVKCPNCNRWKNLQYFLSNNCECDIKLNFFVEINDVSEEQPEGLF